MERDSLLYKLRRKLQIIAYDLLPKEWLSQIYAKIVLGKFLNLKKAITFNEKINWLKIYFYPKNELVVKCSDKYAVRSYVSEKGFSDKLTHLLGVWDNAKDINWESLPDKFILKCTHGSAYNILCSNKILLNKKQTVKTLNKWIKEDFGKFNIEPHYSQIKDRKIICEEFLGEKIIDYKFFCFHGEPKFYYVSSNMIDDRRCEMSFFNLDGTKIPLIRKDYKDMGDVQIPEFFDEMLNMSRVLSKDFPFVRVDFFLANNTYYFAELTFAPAGGLMPINPRTFDLKWGRMLKIKDLSI